MGRVRTKNMGLPPNLYVKGGAFYLRMLNGKEKKIAGVGEKEKALRLYSDATTMQFLMNGGNVVFSEQVPKAWLAVVAAQSFGDLPRWAIEIYKRAAKGAKQRGIPFALFENDFVTIIKRSNGQCEASGIEFDFASQFQSAKTKIVRKPFAPSLDRTNSQQGYSLENCRLVCTAVNYALSCWGDAVLKKMAVAVVGKYRLSSDLCAHDVSSENCAHT